MALLPELFPRQKLKACIKNISDMRKQLAHAHKTSSTQFAIFSAFSYPENILVTVGRLGTKPRSSGYENVFLVPFLPVKLSLRTRLAFLLFPCPQPRKKAGSLPKVVHLINAEYLRLEPASLLVSRIQKQLEHSVVQP